MNHANTLPAFAKKEARIPLAVLIYIIVILSLFPQYSVPFSGGVDITFLKMYCLLLFPFFMFFCLFRSKVPNITVVGILHIIYILISALGILFAGDTSGVLRGTAAYITISFLPFLYIVTFIENKEQIKKIMFIFVILGILNAIMGYVQLIGFFFFGKIIALPFIEYFKESVSTKNFGYGTGAYSIPGFVRMFGFQGDGFAPYQIVPLGFSFYFYRYSGSKKSFALAFVFIASSIFLSMTRCAMIGGFVFCLMLYFFKRSNKFRLKYPFITRLYLPIFAALALFGFAFMTGDSRLFDNSTVSLGEGLAIKTPVYLLQRLNPFASDSYLKSADYFTSHFSLAIKHGFDNLGFGLGTQNFDDYVYERYPVKYGSHSNFIIFLGDNGIWGFTVQVLIAALLIFIGLGLYYKQDESNEADAAIPLYLVAIFSGLIVTGVLRTFYLMPTAFIVGGLLMRMSTFKKVNQMNLR